MYVARGSVVFVLGVLFLHPESSRQELVGLDGPLNNTFARHPSALSQHEEAPTFLASKSLKSEIHR